MIYDHNTQYTYLNNKYENQKDLLTNKKLTKQKNIKHNFIY